MSKNIRPYCESGLINKRNIGTKGFYNEGTPILLPSFSSKGFPNVDMILKVTEEFISDEVLVSAYDVHYKKINPPFDFATTVFVDSGGYEASKDLELSEVYGVEYKFLDWTSERYLKTIDEWESNTPTVFVSFDHPNHRCSIADQIERSKELPPSSETRARSLLLKPETKTQIRLNISNILKHIHEIGKFDIVGVTEKEIGNCVLDRMLNIAKLRQALNKCGYETPIHIFGALDTISTYLYFVSGADIFDGLSWLRFAFYKGDTIYQQSFGTMTLPFKTNSDIVKARCWSNNYHYMQDMRIDMMKFHKDGDYAHFKEHEVLIKNASQSLHAVMEGN